MSGFRAGLLTALTTLIVVAPAGAGSSPEAVAVVESMIAAHGGMERWASAPTVSFEDELKPGEAFSKPFDVSRMTMPEGAVVDTSTP